MRRHLRDNALLALIAGGGIYACTWLGLYSYAWNDYEIEAQHPLEALLAGHLADFLREAPAYGGSLLIRAPFGYLAKLAGADRLGIYWAISLPCMFLAAGLGVWLAARMRASGRSSLAGRVLVVVLCAANPLTIRALELGHAEELLGAVLCVGAVVLAGRGRALAAGALLGIAIASKESAVIALGPVLLALPAASGVRSNPPAGERARVASLRMHVARAKDAISCVLAAAALAALLLAPFLLVPAGRFAALTRGAASTSSAIFQPWQLWWFLGYHGPVVRGTLGNIKPGYRTAPAWIGHVSHPAVVLAAALAALALWRLRSVRPREHAARTHDALLALALVVLLRCMLDTWNNAYYELPLLFALLAWEALERPWRPPLLALIASASAWAVLVFAPEAVDADVQSLLFLIWSLPLLATLATMLFAPRALAGLRAAAPAVGARPRPGSQSIDVSVFGNELSTRLPLAVTTTRSSMRTPSSPGR